MPTDQTELAWAAGFFDGEGHTGCIITPRSRRIKVEITQSEDPPLNLTRFAVAVGVGKVYGPYNRAVTRQYPNRRPHYFFNTGKNVEAEEIMAKLWPWLGATKKMQASMAIQKFHADKRGPHVN